MEVADNGIHDQIFRPNLKSAHACEIRGDRPSSRHARDRAPPRPRARAHLDLVEGCDRRHQERVLGLFTPDDLPHDRLGNVEIGERDVRDAGLVAVSL